MSEEGGDAGAGSGHIVYVSSLLGRGALPIRVGYAASKWALEAIGETLAAEAHDSTPYGELFDIAAAARAEDRRPEASRGDLNPLPKRAYWPYISWL